MAKDAYYFPHDSNAKDDPKCVMLIEELQLEGYGIYWILIETLREQPDFKYPMKLIPALARRYFTTKEKMTAVIKGYDLFEIEGDEFFYSESLLRRMEIVNEKREKAKLAGKKSGEVRRLRALASDNVKTVDEQMLNGCSADVEQKVNNKRKEKEIKEKEKESISFYVQHHHLKLTETERDELIKKHGKKDVDDMINKIKSFTAEYLSKYENMSLVIDAWIKKNKENGIDVAAKQTPLSNVDLILSKYNK
jgi:hypothetical protein